MGFGGARLAVVEGKVSGEDGPAGTRKRCPDEEGSESGP